MPRSSFRLPAGDTRAEMLRIMALAWPVMLTSLNWTLMQVMDVAIVGHAGTAQLGYLAAGRTVVFVTIVMGLSALSGVLVFTARADGAGAPAATGDWLRRGLILALLTGLPCMLAMQAFARPLLDLVGVPPTIAAGGAPVTRAMALAYPFQFVQIAAANFLEGVSRPRRVAAVNLATLPLNAVLAWAWTGGHLGLPALGAVGAVLATSLVAALGAAGMLAAAWTLPDAWARSVRDLSGATWAGAWRGVPELARFGLVPALTAGLELFGFAWLIILSTRLGTVASAAFQTVFALHNFTFSLAIGFASAAGVRAGNAVGAGQPRLALPRATIATALTIAAMGMFGFGLWVAGPTVVRPFSGDPAVIAATAAMLAMIAPFMWLDGAQMVCVYTLRALGDQVAAGVNGAIAFFVVTGGLGSLLVARGLGAPALIVAFVGGLLAAALLQGGRLLLVSGRMRRG